MESGTCSHNVLSCLRRLRCQELRRENGTGGWQWGASFSPPESPHQLFGVREVERIARGHGRPRRALGGSPSSSALAFLEGRPLGIEHLRGTAKELAGCGGHPGVAGDGGSFVSEVCHGKFLLQVTKYKVYSPKVDWQNPRIGSSLRI